LNRQGAKNAKNVKNAKKNASKTTATAEERKGKQKQNKTRNSEVLCGFSLRFLCDLCASAVSAFVLAFPWRLGGSTHFSGSCPAATARRHVRHAD
jgi:hypothetical protein